MDNITTIEKLAKKNEKYNCEYCGKEFERTVTKGRKKRFCDDNCRVYAKNLRFKNKYEHTCKQCGSIFTSHRKNDIYCSVSCQATYRSNQTVEIKCKQCGHTFAGKKGLNYCSDECKYETRICPQCSKKFKVPRNWVYKKTFCSRKCQGRSEAKHISTCENCSSEFTGRNNRMNKFCSRKCFYEKLGYEEHNVKRTNHLSDASSIKRAIENGVEYEHIDVLEVFERDKWTCGICGDVVDDSLVYPDTMSASLDHIIPLSRGGSHTYENVQCSHLKCNIKKYNH
ncbi:HNH endonuclease [Anaerobacillus isosaccharinicus]|uniref:HNH endonuclease n=1 Tax=Anaerobacillus isosaccharinicus TaxID=1532552 RepID=A0A1S2LBB4_9BACI|nr:HNH endonuclease signature motif containing protein [Anaerobacillus isosaccharinicus]MBA5584564.1 HNH endonuclease [Anaerobacillus isosaccharinicus]QOY37053.1 HNH endonuclease [Anaerobacillus isosaccharinicus]